MGGTGDMLRYMWIYMYCQVPSNVNWLRVPGGPGRAARELEWLLHPAVGFRYWRQRPLIWACSRSRVRFRETLKNSATPISDQGKSIAWPFLQLRFRLFSVCP